MKKKKKKAHSTAAVNSKLLRRPIRRFGWLFLLPMAISFFIGFIWPFLQGMFLSFCKFRTTKKWTFVGFDNYLRILDDEQFLYSFIYTAIWTIVSVVLINVIAFAVAYALTQGIKGTNFFRTVFFMPNLIGGIVLGYIWSMIFDGILSYYNTNILEKTEFGFWGLIILMCWQQVGYMMIIYVAGLQAVPEDMIEAAKIDGASGWKTLTRITIPNVMPSITICTFLSLTNGFKLYDQNLALTEGLPGVLDKATGLNTYTTEMIALNISKTFGQSGAFSKGEAQAKAVIFFILVATIGLLQLTSTRKKEVQQ